MGDNKKPKQDYREALAAQAEKVAPKKADPKEMVYVMVGNMRVPIVRGDMSDADWADVKKRAVDVVEKETGKVIEPVPQGSQPAEGPSREEADRILRMRSKIDRQVEKDNKEPGQYADEDLRSLEATGSMGGGGGGGGGGDSRREEPRVPKKRDQGSPDEWKPYPSEPQKSKSPSTQTEDDPMVGSADPGMSPRGQMMRLAMGASPSSLEQTNADINKTSSEAMAALPSNPKKVSTEALRSLVSEEDGRSATPSNPALVQGAEQQLATKFYGQDGSPVDPGVPPQPGMLDQINDAATGVRQAITDVVTNPAGTIPPMMQRLAEGAGQMVNQGGPFGSRPPRDAIEGGTGIFPPAIEGATPGQAPAPAPQQGGSISMSSKTPGNAQMPVVNKADPYIQQIKEDAKLAQQLDLSATEIARQKIAADADLRRQAMAEKAKLDADNVAQQKAYEDTISQRQMALQNLQQQVLDLSKESIDPNRFWNNKDAGQKAAAVIAGALFGFTGQGMQWLQRLDSLVAQDIQAQAADLNRRRGLLGDAAGMQENLVAMAEKQGLRGQAAYNAAVVAHKENLANQLELNAMNYSDPALQVAAQQKALAIRQSAQKEIKDYQMDTQKTAMDNRYKLAQIRHLEAQNMALAAKATQGAKGEPLPAAVSKRLDESMRAYQNVAKMAQLAENNGAVDRMKRAAKETPLGALVTGGEEKANSDLYGQLQVELMKQRAGGALQSHEVELLTPLVGGSRSGVVDPAPTARKTAQQFRDQLITTLRSEAAAGRDVSEYMRVLQSIDAGSSSAPPSYATPR